MSQPICVRTLVATLLLAAASLLPTASLTGQTMVPVLDGSDLAVTYSKPNDTTVTVEQSTDLISWSPADSRDILVSSDGASQTIKSSVAASQPASLFVRLRVAQAWVVRLAWDAVPDSAVAGYRLYYNRIGILDAWHQFDVGSQTTATVSLPEDGSVYTFVVTCYDFDGLESGPSERLDVGELWNG